MGRPRKEIDWHLLDSLCGLNAQLDYCCEKQIPLWDEEVNHRTIKACREIIEMRVRERFDLTFSEYRHQRLEELRISLFMKQVEIAKGGNVAMLIWLGKQHLGQSEKLETKNENTNTQTIEYKIGWADEDHATPHQASPPNASTEAH